MGRAAQRFAFAWASTFARPSRSSSEHSPPPRSLYGLLRLYRTGPGLCPIRLLLDRLSGFCRLLRGLYGWDLASELGHDGVVSPTLLGSGLPLGVQLVPKVTDLILQRGDKLRHRSSWKKNSAKFAVSRPL